MFNSDFYGVYLVFEVSIGLLVIIDIIITMIVINAITDDEYSHV